MDPMTKIRELLARINDLTSVELDELKGLIAEHYDVVDAEAATPENVVILQELASGITALMERADAISAAEAQAVADKEATRQVRAALDGTPEGTETDEVVDEVVDEGAKESVTATGRFRSSPSKMTNGNKGITPVVNASKHTSLVAAGNGHGVQAGHEFENKWELAEHTVNVLKGLHPAGANGRVMIASADYRGAYPEERRLGDNKYQNAQRIDAVASPSAITASGGTSLPANVDYSLAVYASPERPIKSALAQFLADRGAVTYRQPPTIAALAGASSVWTEATDVAPGGQTKPVLTVAVPGAQTVYVNAIPTRLQFGNLMGQFDPETIAANTELSLAAAARVAETELLTLIAAASTLDVTSAATLGLSRDLFTTIELAVANFRYTHRINESVRLNIMLPAYVKNMIRADRLSELAHDNQGSFDVFSISDQWIDDAFALRGVVPIWTLDALPVNGIVYPSQQFAGFTASSPIPAYPTKIVWHLFIEGSVQFLDGGLLNLGVVRDATLDSTNDYETFVETFEGIAFRGFAGGALQFVSTWNVNGDSKAGI